MSDGTVSKKAKSTESEVVPEFVKTMLETPEPKAVPEFIKKMLEGRDITADKSKVEQQKKLLESLKTEQLENVRRLARKIETDYKHIAYEAMGKLMWYETFLERFAVPATRAYKKNPENPILKRAAQLGYKRWKEASQIEQVYNDTFDLSKKAKTLADKAETYLEQRTGRKIRKNY